MGGSTGVFRGTFSIQATHCKLEDDDYLTAQTVVEQSSKINVRNQWSNMTWGDRSPIGGGGCCFPSVWPHNVLENLDDHRSHNPRSLPEGQLRPGVSSGSDWEGMAEKQPEKQVVEGLEWLSFSPTVGSP